MFVLVAVFSATVRVVLVPSVNTGARFSFTSDTLTVTVLLAVFRLPAKSVATFSATPSVTLPLCVTVISASKAP